MPMKSKDAARLKLSEDELQVMEEALDILVRRNSPGKKPGKSGKAGLKSSVTELKGYFGNKVDAQIAMLELSLDYGHPVAAELSKKKGCGSACKTTCVVYCKGSCEGGCKTGLAWF